MTHGLDEILRRGWCQKREAVSCELKLSLHLKWNSGEGSILGAKERLERQNGALCGDGQEPFRPGIKSAWSQKRDKVSAELGDEQSDGLGGGEGAPSNHMGCQEGSDEEAGLPAVWTSRGKSNPWVISGTWDQEQG